MADDPFLSKNSKIFKAGQSWIVDKVNSTLDDKISDPRLRNAAGSVLGSLAGNFGIPGFGTTNYGENSYNDMIAERVRTAQEQQREELGVSGTPSTGDFLQQSGKIQSDADNPLGKSMDWRARLRPKKGGEEKFYSIPQSEDGTPQPYLMAPIRESGGMVWQYTPTVYLSATAEYDQKLMQGMNYPINTFISGRPPDLPVQADFTANNEYEARYLLAILTFLRVATKAYFGDPAVASKDYGTPPPVLIFEYLGDHGFNKVPVVVTNYQMGLTDDVDYVPVVYGNTTTYVPTKTNIMVNLTPTYTPHKIRRRFDLNSIASGAAYKDGFI